jgi:hypothetical protein
MGHRPCRATRRVLKKKNQKTETNLREKAGHRPFNGRSRFSTWVFKKPTKNRNELNPTKTSQLFFFGSTTANSFQMHWL